MVDGAGLENQCRACSTGGSNPSPSVFYCIKRDFEADLGGSIICFPTGMVVDGGAGTPPKRWKKVRAAGDEGSRASGWVRRNPDRVFNEEVTPHLKFF